MKDDRIYLDYAATSPLLPAARAAMDEGFALWANPSSPHAEGRRARARLEAARADIAAALGWRGTVILTSGATEAIALALGRVKARAIAAGATEHDAVLRHMPPGQRLPVDAGGHVQLPRDLAPATLVAIQHVNSETGVIQPIAALAEAIHAAGGWLLCDCSQSAGKIDLPEGADMIVISGHKLGGPIGIGALLVRDPALLDAAGGQEQGYRAGTENLPGAMGMAAALKADRTWLAEAARLRARIETAVTAGGGVVVAAEQARISTISGYRMPGVDARTQLVRFDIAGIAVSAGSACASGSLKPGHVLAAMGWEERAAGEVIRISLGQASTERQIDAFLYAWHAMATGMQQK